MMHATFGVLADLHTEFVYDAAQRFHVFLEQCREHRVDFCVDLGDFCPPGERNRAQKERILHEKRTCGIPFYHVLGNHDLDENDKSAVLRYIGAEARRTSFVVGGIRFLIVDANFYREGDVYIPYDHGNYKSASAVAELPVLPPEELTWLRRETAESAEPVVLFSHQSLIESRTGIRNPDAFREAVPHALFAICGHEHVDRLEKREETWYYCVNSASYYWAGAAYAHDTYAPLVTEAFPPLRHVFPYREPVFAIIDVQEHEIRIHGRRSTFVGCTPDAMGFTKKGLMDPITPSVIDRVIEL